MADFSKLDPVGFRDELNKLNIWTSGGESNPVAPLSTVGKASYVVPGEVDGTGPVEQTLIADRYFFVPILLREASQLGDIVCHVITAGTSPTTRMGVYDSDAEGLPGARQVDAGTVDASTTGEKRITISLNLSAGWYWLVLVCDDGNVGFRAYRLSTLMVIDAAVDSAIQTAFISDFGETADATAIVDPAPAPAWNGRTGGVVFATVDAQP